MWGHLNRDCSVEVGASERHVVAFQWRQGPAEMIITVDGVEALRERRPFGVRRTRQYEVTVGQRERHRVIVEKTKPPAYGGVRQNSFRVLVDDQLAAEC
jgi:hypothetical protein